MKQEIWKTIPNYEDYQVSNLGNVKSLKFGKEKILKPGKNGKGYLTVRLYLNKKSKTFNVHQLVAIAFLKHKPNGYEKVVNHINFNRLDNRLSNLEIVTVRENTNLKHIKSSSKYVGVCWNKKNKKWQSNIFIDDKKKHLGCFINEYDAHIAYENKLKELNK